MKKAGVNQKQNEVENSTVEEIDDVKEIESNLSYIYKINDFMSRNEILDSQTVYYLYKFDHPQAGESKAFIDKFSEVDPPDEDQIGRKYGSGRYLVVMAIARSEQNEKGLVRAYRLKIHSRYDSFTKDASFPGQPVQSVQQLQPQNNLSDSLDMLTKLITALAPIFQAKTNQQNSIPDFSSMLFRNYEQTSEVLKKSMLENVRLNSDLQSKLMALSEENNNMNNTEVEEEEVGILEQLKPLLVEWLPKLIGTNAESKAVQAVVKSAPQLKKIINNTAEYKKLISYLDQAQGVEITNKILSNLKLKRA